MNPQKKPGYDPLGTALTPTTQAAEASAAPSMGPAAAVGILPAAPPGTSQASVSQTPPAEPVGSEEFVKLLTALLHQVSKQPVFQPPRLGVDAENAIAAYDVMRKALAGS